MQNVQKKLFKSIYTLLEGLTEKQMCLRSGKMATSEGTKFQGWDRAPSFRPSDYVKEL